MGGNVAGSQRSDREAVVASHLGDNHAVDPSIICIVAIVVDGHLSGVGRNDESGLLPVNGRSGAVGVISRGIPNGVRRGNITKVEIVIGTCGIDHVHIEGVGCAADIHQRREAVLVVVRGRGVRAEAQNFTSVFSDESHTVCATNVAGSNKLPAVAGAAGARKGFSIGQGDGHATSVAIYCGIARSDIATATVGLYTKSIDSAGSKTCNRIGQSRDSTLNERGVAHIIDVVGSTGVERIGPREGHTAGSRLRGVNSQIGNIETGGRCTVRESGFGNEITGGAGDGTRTCGTVPLPAGTSSGLSIVGNTVVVARCSAGYFNQEVPTLIGVGSCERNLHSGLRAVK